MPSRGKVVKFMPCSIVQTKDSETQNNETLKEAVWDVEKTVNVSKETEGMITETGREMEVSDNSAPELLLRFGFGLISFYSMKRILDFGFF